MKLTLPIGKGWLRDLPKSMIREVGGLFTAKNVLPIALQYYPVGEPEVFNSTTIGGSTVASGIAVQGEDGVFRNFVGVGNKLYRVTEGTMATLSASMTLSSAYWAFEQYGQWLIATNFSNNPIVIKDSSGAGPWKTLGGSPPKAKYILFNNHYMILAYLDEGGTVEPKKICWSALENPEDWTPSRITGAGSQNFPDMKGVITGIGPLGGDFVIASEESLTIGYFVGGNWTFAFRPADFQRIGCKYPGSFISIGDAVFFWGRDSIYKMTPGAPPVDICEGRIKVALFSSINANWHASVRAAHDKRNSLILWSYPSSGNTGATEGICDQILVYNYSENRFTHIELDSWMIMEGYGGGVSVDALTQTPIDTPNLPSIDSVDWIAASPSIMILGGDGVLKTLTGETMKSEIETGEVCDIPSLFMIRRVWPWTEGSATMEVAIKHRYRLDREFETWELDSANDGIDVRVTTRRFILNLQASGFNAIDNKIDVDIEKHGQR